MTSYKRKSVSITSSTDSESDSDTQCMKMELGAQRRNRQPKSFSKNAQMARENRLRKKIYVETLEKEVARSRAGMKKLDSQLKEQLIVIKKQEREIKFMKSVLANSADLGKLLRNINVNTGMCVGTSLNKNLTILTSNSDSPTPWNENYSPDDLLLPENCLSDIDHLPLSPLPFTLDDDETIIEESTNAINKIYDDHAYTLMEDDEQTSDDVGICLHVSKHRVALEFCATCNENASSTWKGLDI